MFIVENVLMVILVAGTAVGSWFIIPALLRAHRAQKSVVK